MSGAGKRLGLTGRRSEEEPLGREPEGREVVKGSTAVALQCQPGSFVLCCYFSLWFSHRGYVGENPTSSRSWY